MRIIHQNIVLFAFAFNLAGVVLTLPAGPDGSSAWTGLNFIYNPDVSRLNEPSVWLASAGQIFFTLSVGMGSLQAYASYLSTKDDIALNCFGPGTVLTEGLAGEAAKPMLEAFHKKFPDSKAVIAGDKDISHGAVMEVIDMVREVGIEKFALRTKIKLPAPNDSAK